ncbi:MAG: ArsC family reductase [Gammaproteobacteria bacterium]|jgi:Spx/MgsR family transcriptional regulator|nr:ArsC family reductase [Gammaproteobacteria bacterium]MBT4606083.1 ArsC family reductase [Thiotrichales bacterium]MBT3471864.1 ArsC family reductase [Gammaproteobacteria bacterium]MBT3967111.1 ArsC family reductase [Gammaproteobacteria bacterium]MBT4082007.1 ArsC family reductase [Gammaproteobacteria bacterium]
MNILYGIPNCDTIRKAKKWLTAHDIAFQFHDFRKDGLTQGQLQQWIDQVGWELLLNRRGTTWRQLPQAQRDAINEASAIILLLEHPAMIKRPVLQSDRLKQVELGFSESRYQDIYN